MYNYYQPQTQIQRPLFLKGHPVSSIEEVRATGVDFDGSVFYFPDVANGKIYTKQINADGTASIVMYEAVPLPAEPKIGDFITRDEFQQVLNELKASISQKPAVIPQTANTKPQINNF